MNRRRSEPPRHSPGLTASFILMMLAAIGVCVLVAIATGCTRIELPGGATYTNFFQDKSYEVFYIDPNSGRLLRAQINVKNDPTVDLVKVLMAEVRNARGGGVAPLIMDWQEVPPSGLSMAPGWETPQP